MTPEGWLKAIKEMQSDHKMLGTLASYLSEIDEVKQILGDKGYRIQGQSLLEAVKQIPYNAA